MFFLTYNDSYSGIYNSQVIDVCRFIKKEYNIEVHLIVFVSLRLYKNEKRKIKAAFPSAHILPMFPGIKNWSMNYFALLILALIKKPGRIIARGPFAANLALRLKRANRVNSVIFDARGAYLPEFTEYNIVQDIKFLKELAMLEKIAIIESDFKIAVSNSLVNYWQKEYGYNKSNHVIIPCTLDQSGIFELPSESLIIENRQRLGFLPDEIIVAFSGSASGWHSFLLMNEFLLNLLKENEKLKVLLLTKAQDEFKILNEFKDRVVTKWVDAKEVFKLLSICDYGLLLREKTITNNVASPVKFAEYLAAGLKVLISENIGDFSDFVSDTKSGVLVTDLKQKIELTKVNYNEKESLNKLAKMKFTKYAYKDAYNTVVSK
ncbi:MAG: hypothetical protein M3Q58_12220 [Bacteroidota bacterium]|nr:hypothetical protein [Bacteroidota bacterium]